MHDVVLSPTLTNIERQPVVPERGSGSIRGQKGNRDRNPPNVLLHSFGIPCLHGVIGFTGIPPPSQPPAELVHYLQPQQPSGPVASPWDGVPDSPDRGHVLMGDVLGRPPPRNLWAVDRCDGCGFEYDLGEAMAARSAIVRGVEELTTLLSNSDDLRTRRVPGIWSPLEYGCHVRDVLLVQRERVLAALIMDCPSFNPMGRDERVEYDGYAEQEGIDVVRQLGDAALLFAYVLSRFDTEQWERTVMYSYPRPFERPLRWVAVHTVHEVEHHVLDVRLQLA